MKLKRVAGNIGTDLAARPQRCSTIDAPHMVGVVESDGRARAREQAVAANAEGADWLLRTVDVAVAEVS